MASRTGVREAEKYWAISVSRIFFPRLEGAVHDPFQHGVVDLFPDCLARLRGRGGGNWHFRHHLPGIFYTGFAPSIAQIPLQFNLDMIYLSKEQYAIYRI